MSSDILDVQSEAWNQVELHTFTTLPEKGSGPTSRTPPWSNSPTLTTRNSDPRGLGTVNSVVVAIAGLLVLLLVGLVFCRLKKSRQLKRLQKMAVINMPVLEYRDYSMFSPGERQDGSRPDHCPVVVDEWELPLSCVKFGPILGSGAFGKVVKGRVTRAMLTHRGVAPLLQDDRVPYDDVTKLHVTVAIKMLQAEANDRRYKQDFLKEIQLMKKIGHHEYIVSMLGCCTLRDPICLIVEHAEFGDLLSYLKDLRHQLMASLGNHYVNKNTDNLSPKDLLRFAWQVTQGMNFLASKGFVHRDLAARNVLVCVNRTCKIGDFGLARYIYDNAVYVNRRGGRLPVKWMSVEAIFDMSFSTASDVWSFGILLYEIVTLGGTPYPTISTRDLLTELQRGYRMERPTNCSSETYEMMMQCWQANPNDRPTFSFLSQWLQSMISDTSGAEYVDLPLNFDRDLYNVEDDNNILDNQETAVACGQHSSIGSRSSQYSGVLLHDSESTSATDHKALSEDSGYSSPQKESISSGDSALNLPADAAPDHRYWTEVRPDITHSESSITFLDTNRSMNFLPTFSDGALDDVFHEDEGIAMDEDVETRASTCQEKAKTTLCLRSDGSVKASQICRDHTIESRSKLKHRHARLRRQSLPTSSTPLSEKCLVRRSSDSYFLVPPKETNGRSEAARPNIKVFKTVEVFRQVKKNPGHKQRRTGVVIPPTLALDNDMYLATETLPRQDPPAVRISRKKRRNKGLQSINPQTWTDDGQINFKRSKAAKTTTENKSNIILSPERSNIPVPDNNLSDQNNRRKSITVEADVHREVSLSKDDQAKSSLKNECSVLETVSKNSLESPRVQTRPHTKSSLKEQTRSPKAHRTFVRSGSSALTPDSSVSRRKNGSKKKAARQHQPVRNHQYTDFQKIVHQSTTPPEARSTNAETSFPALSKYGHLNNKEYPHTGENRESNTVSSDDIGKILAKTTSFPVKYQNDASQCWKNTSVLNHVLGPLSQVLRRTYSSPKEDTLAEGRKCDQNDGRSQKDESSMLYRRLSDPCTMPVNRVCQESSCSQHSKTCSSRSLPLVPYTAWQYASTTSSGQSAPCFRWPHSRRRKKAVTVRPKLDFDVICTRPFQNEKHPTALHHVANIDVNWG